MEDSKELKPEFVDLLRKQVEALELEAYVGLTDEERSEYYERQERIRDLVLDAYASYEQELTRTA